MLDFSCSFADEWPQIWQRCITQFLEAVYYRRSKSHDTLDSYRSTLRLFFSFTGKPPERVTNADVQEFLCTRFDGRDTPVSTGTQNVRLGILASFYGYASTYQVTSKAGKSRLLFTDIKPTLGIITGKRERSHRTLSETQLERFFAAIPTTTIIGIRDRAIFTLFFYSARRRREIARLRWGDIERGTVTDEQGNSRPGWTYRFRGKGRPYDDYAELPEPAYQAIMAYLHASKRLATIKPNDPLFLPAGKVGLSKRTDPKAPLSSKAMYFQLKKYAKLAGLDPKRVCLHSLRHSSANQRYLRGESLRSIQRLFRHSSIQITELYVAEMTSTSDQGARLLESRFRFLSTP